MQIYVDHTKLAMNPEIGSIRHITYFILTLPLQSRPSITLVTLSG